MHRRLNQRLRKRIEPYLYMLGFLILTGTLLIYPVCYAINISLYQTYYTKLTKFVGLRNYIKFFLNPEDLASIYKSLQYVGGSLLIAVTLGVFLGVILNKISYFRTGFRLVIFLPWVFSQVITALLWRWIFNLDYGSLNSLLTTLGFEKLGFLSNASLAMFSLIAANVWLSYPIATIFVLAGLQNISPSLYEAAKIDGASNWQCFLHISFPLLQSTLMVILILLSVTYFNMVPLIYTLTGGGPFNSTRVLSFTAYQVSFDFWEIGYGSAIGIIILGFNILFGIMHHKVFGRQY